MPFNPPDLFCLSLFSSWIHVQGFRCCGFYFIFYIATQESLVASKKDLPLCKIFQRESPTVKKRFCPLSRLSDRQERGQNTLLISKGYEMGSAWRYNLPHLHWIFLGLSWLTEVSLDTKSIPRHLSTHTASSVSITQTDRLLSGHEALMPANPSVSINREQIFCIWGSMCL